MIQKMLVQLPSMLFCLVKWLLRRILLRIFRPLPNVKGVDMVKKRVNMCIIMEQGEDNMAECSLHDFDIEN